MDGLDDDHRAAFRRAMTNILRLKVAENAFAQLIDGLPTADGLGDVLKNYYMRIPADHPVMMLQHNVVCEHALKTARELRETFDLSVLLYEPWVLESFQVATAGTKEFHLRLLELVVVACHQIAAFLYEQDYDGAHPRNLGRDWYEDVERRKAEGDQSVKFTPTNPLLFFHPAYRHPERCPRGEADIAGYWAEGQIFGGVIVFERGESSYESRSVWFHGQADRPRTLYPPTEEQFRAIMAYLLSDLQDPSNNDIPHTCPLPIRGEAENRPRWDPYEGLAKFNIFRDKAALKLPRYRFVSCRGHNRADWPEVEDVSQLGRLQRAQASGEKVDLERLEALQARSQWITPTSPEYRPMPDWVCNSYSQGPGYKPMGLRQTEDDIVD